MLYAVARFAKLSDIVCALSAILVKSITQKNVATINTVVLVLYILPVTVGDFMNRTMMAASATNRSAAMSTICHTLKYLSMIVIVFLAISISIAENGVILNPRTMQFVIPSISHANDITQYPNILFLMSSESVSVKKMIEQLYRNMSG